MKSSCLRPLAALLLTVGLAACGGKASYDVSGTISGLSNAGLVLANGGDTVSPAVGATTFTFPKRIDYGTSPLANATTYAFDKVADGSVYNIVIETQPKGQTCRFAGSINGNDTVGTMGSAATSAATLNCTSPQ